MRIPRHALYMKIARCVSERSTCHRLNVGAVITLDNRIVSSGYNGTAAGLEHCRGNDCPLSNSGGCTRAIHAEDNAISRVPFVKEPKGDYRLYVTHSPCEACAHIIIDSQGIIDILEIYYEIDYRETKPLHLLMANQIEVFKITPGGYLTDKRTNKVSLLND